MEKTVMVIPGAEGTYPPLQGGLRTSQRTRYNRRAGIRETEILGRHLRLDCSN